MITSIKKNHLLYFLLLILPSNILFAQHQEDSVINSEKQKEIEKRRQIVNAYLSDSGIDRINQQNGVPFNPDSATVSVQQLTWKNYYEYKNFGYAHRQKVFKWQLFSSKLIFFVVVILVLSGIYFAGLQFFHAIRLSKNAGDIEKLMNTELSANKNEIKVSSPVLGVIILIISFLFFFLYLKFVYPIQDTF